MKTLLILLALLLPTTLSAQLRYATTGVRLRAEPSAEAAVLATMPKGSSVLLYDCEHGGGEWCRILFQGHLGYAAKRYLSEAYVASAPAKSSGGASKAPRPSSAESRGYYRGPRGGCYTYSRTGKKRYVDRSLCD